VRGAVRLGIAADVLAGAWLLTERGLILLDGVLKSLGGDPVLISHSEAMSVAVRTFVLRGIWVLMRRFSNPILSPSLAPLRGGSLC
jgi:hypothetical protein